MCLQHFPNPKVFGNSTLERRKNGYLDLELFLFPLTMAWCLAGIRVAGDTNGGQRLRGLAPSYSDPSHVITPTHPKLLSLVLVRSLCSDARAADLRDSIYSFIHPTNPAKG
jgi:hypothetical protein